MSNCPKIVRYRDMSTRRSHTTLMAASGTWPAGSFFKLDANGKWADYLADSTNNTDNGAADVVAGFITYPLTATAGDEITMELCLDHEFPFPATVDSPASASDCSTTPTRAMIGDRMCVRRIQSDQVDTNWASRYAAVTDKTTNGALECVDIDTNEKTVYCRFKSAFAFGRD